MQNASSRTSNSVTHRIEKEIIVTGSKFALMIGTNVISRMLRFALWKLAA